MDLIFYTIIILTGYLATYDSTPDIVVKRGPPPGYEKDYFIMFSQVAIAGAVCITIPINFIALRKEVYNLFFKGAEPSVLGYF